MLQVKPEPGTGSGDLDDSDEELSEGEELRRAAQAYRAVAKKTEQVVIVLDDSSDEDEEKKRSAKRRAVPAEQPRSRPIQQQVISHAPSLVPHEFVLI